ncbi:hypothetical protein [Buchnera aphidicola]|uniref:hypothetical protein n=1 Tax=Buchnera aphidicola TaxID=9 RepID=UPI00094DCEE3|nr:hypothetical protein [Buchnera aphidicola]
MSPIFSINSNKKFNLNPLNEYDCSEKLNATPSKNIKKREIHFSKNKHLRQKNLKRTENKSKNLYSLPAEFDNDAIYNIKNPITNSTYSLPDPNNYSPLPDNAKIKEKKTFGETVPFEQFSEDLKEGSYGKACASLGMDLLGLLPSAGPGFRGSLEKISSFVKSSISDQKNDDSNTVSPKFSDLQDISSNAIAGTYSCIGLPGSLFSLPPHYNKYHIDHETPVTFSKKNLYDNVNHAVSSIYNEGQAAWKMFKSCTLEQKTNNFARKLQNSYLRLNNTRFLNKNFLTSLLKKEIYINGKKIPASDSIAETIKNIQKIIPDYNAQQLVSTYAHPGVLKMAEKQLLKEHPEINDRISQNMHITYRIDQVDNESFRISILKHAYLRPSMFHSPNDIHAYGLRANMLISKTSRPKLQFTYFAQ